MGITGLLTVCLCLCVRLLCTRIPSADTLRGTVRIVVHWFAFRAVSAIVSQQERLWFKSQQGPFLCRDCIFSMSVWALSEYFGFFPQPKDMHEVRLIGHSRDVGGDICCVLTCIYVRSQVEYVEGTALVLGFEDPMVRTDDTPVKRCLQTKWPYIELLWTTDRSPSLN